jgi:hypothetical protein
LNMKNMDESFEGKNWMEKLNEKGWFNNVWDEKVDEHSYKI